MVQLLVSWGKMAEAEMATSPLQNKLYMRLGGEHQPKPELGAAEAQEGDVFMLCSDGFWGSVDPEEVGAVLSEYDLEGAVECLVQLARERGGNGADNITVAMAQLSRVRRKFHVFS
jgi:serine/threonine protein phosphatase PrpC